MTVPWPQVIITGSFVVATLVHILKHGEHYNGEFHGMKQFLYGGLFLWLLYMGGFYDA